MFLATNLTDVRQVARIKNEIVNPMLKTKIKIKRKKKRIPLPQKPPKIEDSKKSYDRKSEKKKAIKKIEEEGSSDA
jgi:hypothetical protein